jgi:AcrR family transcriptional regulator
MDAKKNILREADNLFCQYGIRSVTMDDIAKHLGISKKTIYLHFKDKNELVETLMANLMEDQQCLLNNNVKSATDVIEEIFFSVTHIQSLLSKMNPSLFYDLQKYHPTAWAMFKDFRDKYLFDCIQANLKNGIKQGLYREEINVSILSRMRVEQIDTIFSLLTFPAKQFKLSEVMMEITEHFLFGICTLKGQKLINKYKQIIEEE